MIIRYQYFSLWFRGKFTKCRNFTRRFVWLWRISGVTLRRWWGWFLGARFLSTVYS